MNQLRDFTIQDDGYRPIVNQADLHVGAELTALNIKTPLRPPPAHKTAHNRPWAISGAAAGAKPGRLPFAGVRPAA